MKRESFALQLATLLAGAMILSVNGLTAAATEEDAILARVDDIIITRE